MNWTSILFIIGGALLVWMGYRMIKGNPDAFSRENLSKSFTTVGVLALILIGVVALAVLVLKSSS